MLVSAEKSTRSTNAPAGSLTWSDGVTDGINLRAPFVMSGILFLLVHDRRQKAPAGDRVSRGETTACTADARALRRLPVPKCEHLADLAHPRIQRAARTV